MTLRPTVAAVASGQIIAKASVIVESCWLPNPLPEDLTPRQTGSTVGVIPGVPTREVAPTALVTIL